MVPLIDAAALASAESASDPAVVALDAACMESGFFRLSSAAVPCSLVEGALDAACGFFARPLEEKLRHCGSAATGWRGYTPMGGGHRNFYAHDLWNVKYLHKFKWNHLTEKMAYEQRVKRDKLQQELSAAKKESAFYLRKVDEAKAIAAMEEKRKKKAAAAAGASGGGGGDAAPATAAGKKRKQESGGGGGEGEEGGLQQVRRRFKQRRVAADLLSKMGRNDVLSSLLGGGGD